MTFALVRTGVAAAAAAALVVSPAIAQRPLTEQERALVLQQQVNATQSALIRLEQRLEAIERQLQQVVNQSEMSGHRVNQLESAVTSLRSDVGTRLAEMEKAATADPQPEPAEARAATVEREKPKVELASTSSTPVLKPTVGASDDETPSDPGEDAYSEGFRLWDGGKYDQAITALRAFSSAFPKHRRVSFANNLVGRALLDKGQPRAAAEALLANYRGNPKGERAPDSLYYLGQSLMKLGQPAQACKAYAELEEVYGSSIRADLRSLVNKGKADAGCS